MIISHRYRFIFIKTMKTAGTSVEIFLSQRCAAEDVVTPIHPEVHPHQPRNHRGLWNPLPELVRGAFCLNHPRYTDEKGALLEKAFAAEIAMHGYSY